MTLSFSWIPSADDEVDLESGVSFGVAEGGATVELEPCVSILSKYNLARIIEILAEGRGIFATVYDMTDISAFVSVTFTTPRFEPHIVNDGRKCVPS